MILREKLKQIIGSRGRRLVGRLRPRKWPFTKAYQDHLRGMRALEIGGPSEIFAVKGPLPIYPVLAELHNCNFASRTIWDGEAASAAETIICEATALPVESGFYACVLASHCLEHMANPIKALLEWKRVLRKDGTLLLLLPHRDHTFDWRRPVTSLAHMREDFRHDTPESDLTHLEEVLSLHDLSRDPGAGTPEEFRQRCLRNAEFRAIHHHVFVPESAKALVEEAGFSVVRQDVQGLNIVTLARNS